MYCEHLDWLPEIPSEVLLPLDRIEHQHNFFAHLDDPDRYASYESNDELKDWCRDHIPGDLIVRYQVIRGQLEIHSDVGPMVRKINYMIDPGGPEVLTRWWNPEYTEVIHLVNCTPGSWYMLDVETPHDITAIQRPRVSVVVRDFDLD